MDLNHNGSQPGNISKWAAKMLQISKNETS